MKAFVLAAGLGTRLKPWTLEHPKALVPVGGVPMLQRVIGRLRDEGFNDLTVNVHHFAGQIIDFLKDTDFGVDVNISDESELLLDTGGGLLNASRFLHDGSSPVLVHNADILSDAPLAGIMSAHKYSGADISLVTSPRDSQRKLVFGENGELCGWHNLATDEYRPAGFDVSPGMHENAFSGIYVIGAEVFGVLRSYASVTGSLKFPIMDFLLHNASLAASSPQKLVIKEIELPHLRLIDIGKPETLHLARSLFG